MYKYAILVAGGSGSRMGSDIPKQFLLLKGKPILWYAVKAFTAVYPDIEIILVLPSTNLEAGDAVAREFPSHKIIVTPGGETRFDSVKNGLQWVRKDSIVFVHDAVRCLLAPALIERCYSMALEKGNAVPAVTATDSIRLETGAGNEPVDRTRIRMIQTPQTFLSGQLINAFRQDWLPSFTDEASVVEYAGGKINLVEGDPANIKITRPIDLVIATELLS